MRFSAAEVLAEAGIDRKRLEADLPSVNPSRIPVRQAPRWFRLFWARGITAVALPWGVYLHPRRLEEPMSALGPLLVHELAHIEQFRRLGPLGWAREYLGDYLRGRRVGLGHREAYRQIGLEVEARELADRYRDG